MVQTFIVKGQSLHFRCCFRCRSEKGGREDQNRALKWGDWKQERGQRGWFGPLSHTAESKMAENRIKNTVNSGEILK